MDSQSLSRTVEEIYRLLLTDLQGVPTSATSVTEELSLRVLELRRDVDRTPMEMSQIQAHLTALRKTVDNINSSLTLPQQTDNLKSSMEKIHTLSCLGNNITQATGTATMVGGQGALNLFGSGQLNVQQLNMQVQMQQQDPGFRNLVMRSSSFFKGNFCKAFIKTEQFQKASSVLREMRKLILTGGPGEGKTTAAVHLITERFPDLIGCVKIQTPEELRAVDLSQVKCLFFEDFCGSLNLELEKAHDFRKLLNDICHTVREQGIVVIFSCRTPIQRQCFSVFSDQELFNENCVVQLSSSKLSEDDKISILKQHLRQKGKDISDSEVRKCIKAFQSPIGLPQCSLLFAGKDELFEMGQKFFQTPYVFLCQDLDLMSRISKAEYGFLTLILFSGAGLKRGDLQDLDANPVYKKVLELAMGGQPLLTAAIRNVYDSVADVYVKHDPVSDIYTFCHDTIKEAMCISFGSKHPTEVLEHCSWSIINNYVYTTPPENRTEKVLIIPVSHHKHLANRFVCEILKGDLYLFQIAGHRVMKDRAFIKAFVKAVEEKDAPQVLLGFGDVTSQSAGRLWRQGSPSLMFYFANREYENINFLKEILSCQYLQRTSTDMYRFNLGKILMHACENGRLRLYKLMMESYAPIWPACLTAAVKQSHVEIVKHLTQHLASSVSSEDAEFVNREILDALFVSVDKRNTELFDFLFDKLTHFKAFDVSLIKPVLFQRQQVSCSVAISGIISRNIDSARMDQLFREIYLVYACKMGYKEGYFKTVHVTEGEGKISPGCLKASLEGQSLEIFEDILKKLGNQFGKDAAEKEKTDTLNFICFGNECGPSMWNLLLSSFEKVPKGLLSLAVGILNLPLVEDLLTRMDITSTETDIYLEEKSETLKEYLQDCARLRKKVGNVQVFLKVHPLFPQMVSLLMRKGARFCKGCLAIAVEGGFNDLIIRIIQSTKTKPWFKEEAQKAFESVCAEEWHNKELLKLLIDCGVRLTDTALSYIAKTEQNIDSDHILHRATPSDLNSALRVFCQSSRPDMCKALIDKGALAGTGCLTNAVQNKNPDVVELILQNISYQKREKRMSNTDVSMIEQEVCVAGCLALVKDNFIAALVLREYEMFEVWTRRTHAEREAIDFEYFLPMLQLSSCRDKLQEWFEAPRKDLAAQALRQSVRLGDVNYYKRLCDRFPEFIEKDTLYLAVQVCCNYIVKDCLERFQLSPLDQHLLNTCLRRSLSSGSVSISKLLLSHGAEISKGCLCNVVVSSADGDTSYTSFIKYLLEVSQTSNYDWLTNELDECVLLSLKQGKKDIVVCLLENGGKLSYGSIKTAAASSMDMLSFVLENVRNDRDSEWMKRDLSEALKYACQNGSSDLFTRLFDFGAHVSTGCLVSAMQHPKLGRENIKCIIRRINEMNMQSTLVEELNNALKIVSGKGDTELYFLIKSTGGKVTGECLVAAAYGRAAQCDIVVDVLNEMKKCYDEDVLKRELTKAVERSCDGGNLDVYRFLRDNNAPLTITCLLHAAASRYVVLIEAILKEVADMSFKEQYTYKESIQSTANILKSMGMRWLVTFIQERFPTEWKI